MKEPVSILLVDDDEEDFLITRDVIEEIENQSYSLDWVASYDEALEQLTEKKHDVYLIDYQLGAFTGLELIEEALNRGCEAPMILLTGYGDLETDKRALQAGAADYMVKGSLNAHQLERSIRYSIQQARNLKKIRDLNVQLEARVVRRTADLAKANEELRQSQLMYRSIAHNYPNGIIAVLDHELKYIFIDGKEMAKLGIKREELLGHSLGEVLPEDLAALMKEQLSQSLAGSEVAFEMTYMERDYMVRGVPLSLGDEKIQEVLMVIDNISEQKQAERNMEQALEKERQLNNLKSRFVSMASHEFRTPLSTIMSSVTLVARYEDPAYVEKRRRHIERIKSSVRNLSNILNDFLSLGKLEEGKIIVQPSRFYLQAFLDSVVEELRVVTKEGQELELSFAGEEREVELDKQLLKNILHNLISNAIKYSPAESRVRIRAEGGDGGFALEVEDEGMGIPEEEQRHLFERFFRAHNATNIQGTGLGLSLVKEYVQLMNGNITFNSTLNKGTTFRVNFPLNGSS